MSVIVKGMEMPIACHLCPLVRFYKHVPNVWCNGTNKRLMTDYDGDPEVYIGRPNWCPLVELPEKHGSLIDRDALPSERVEWEDIVDAPTIVEAEGE